MSREQEFLKRLRLDYIDLKMFVILTEHQESPISISDLQREIGIAYKNLLPHLKKLSFNGWILIKDKGVGRKKEVTLNINDLGVFYFIFGLLAMYTEPKKLEARKNLLKEISDFIESEDSTLKL